MRVVTHQQQADRAFVIRIGNKTTWLGLGEQHYIT